MPTNKDFNDNQNPDESQLGETKLDVPSQPFLKAQLQGGTENKGGAQRLPPAREFARRMALGGGRPAMNTAKLERALGNLKADARCPVSEMPPEVQRSVEALKPGVRRFHGAKFSLGYFRGSVLRSPCANKFGYMSPPAVRAQTRLPFNDTTRNLLDQLGNLMADAGRDATADSTIPAGFTYVGQFVDHDITLDVSSSLDVETDANTIHNMRSPALDLDSVYGDGPALSPYLYSVPTSGNPTAIKLQVGTNTSTGPGGPGGPAGRGGMVQQTDFDVPRMATAAHTAIIGDPRNDENLIIVQLHHAFLRFHNAIVDLLSAAGFTGDIFLEAKRLATHHYQWAVVNDFLKKRICGDAAVEDALSQVTAAVGSPFRMPVEFSVAAYRFGHSQIRDNYWVNFNFPDATLAQIFEFNRPPRLPVFSNWVVDFNAFFDTGVSVPVHNKARKIDSVLANGLEALPGATGLMAVLAARNLRRGLALGLPSGQGMAQMFGVPALTANQLTSGIPAGEKTLLESENKLLLGKTPLWYYVLREAAVLSNGDALGPVGARILARTFVRMLKRDAGSYLNHAGGFTPSLPAAVPGDFTFADLVGFTQVIEP